MKTLIKTHIGTVLKLHLNLYILGYYHNAITISYANKYFEALRQSTL